MGDNEVLAYLVIMTLKCMAVATIEAESPRLFLSRSWAHPSKNCWSGSFWSFLVTSPRLISRSGYGDEMCWYTGECGNEI